MKTHQYLLQLVLSTVNINTLQFSHIGIDINHITKSQKEEAPQKADKKKPEAKKEAQAGQVAEKKEKKQLSGGVSIEDVKVGSGPVAKPGKVVMV